MVTKMQRKLVKCSPTLFLAQRPSARPLRPVLSRSAVDTIAPDNALEAQRQQTMLEFRDFLEADLRRLASKGRESMDWSRYDDKILFSDPITRFEDRALYQANITALLTLFDPSFLIHSVEITGYDTISSRWTMGFNFGFVPTWVLNAKTPGFFVTGTTQYRIDVFKKKVTEHVDTWDSVSSQQFFSIEGAADLIRSSMAAMTMLQPNIPSPKYEVLVRTAAYEVRRYARFVAAEAPMSPAPALTLPLGLSVPLPFTGPNSGNGFNELAGYIFGGNDRQSKMDMTTPVLSSGAGADLKMAFPLDGVTEASAAPAPANPAVTPVDVPEAIVAALPFGGFPTDAEVMAALEALRNALARDGLSFAPDYQLARYNDPLTPPFLRRNEILIKLEGYRIPSAAETAPSRN